MSSSRIIEMVDALMAREHLGLRTELSPDIPHDMKALIAATFAVKFALYGRMLPPEIYEDLREDISMLFMVLLGKDTLKGQSFKSAYEAASKDFIENLRRKAEGY